MTMNRNMRRATALRALAMMIVMMISSGGPLAGQSRARASADAKELADYRLTMETVQRVDRTFEHLAAALRTDPQWAARTKEEQALRRELQALEDKDDLTEADERRMEEIESRLDTLDESEPAVMGSGETLDDMEASLKRFAPMATALQKAGLAPREFAKFMLISLQVGMVMGLQQAGLLKELPPEVNPDNIRFMKEHEAELRVLQEKWQQLGRP